MAKQRKYKAEKNDAKKKERNEKNDEIRKKYGLN